MAGNVSAWVEGREGGEEVGEREGGWWEGGERDRWKGEPIGLVGFGQPMPIFKGEGIGKITLKVSFFTNMAYNKEVSVIKKRVTNN